MSPFKKITFGLFVLLAAGLGGWGYFHLKENKKPGLEALAVLPDSCMLYLHTPDFFELNKKLNSQSLIADKLKQFAEVDDLCNTLRVFDSLFRSNNLVVAELQNNPVHFALYRNMNWLAAFNIRQLGSQQQVVQESARLLKAVEKEGAYEFRLAGRAFYFSVSQGVVVFSNKSALLAEAVKSGGAKLYENKAFYDFKSSLEETNLLSVYVSHELYTQSKARQRLNLSLIAENGISSGAIEVQPSQIKINGYYAPGTGGILPLLMEQEPQPTDFINALPLGTHAFKAYGFSSFWKLKGKLDLAQREQQNAEFWARTNDTALYDADREFYANVERHLVDFETDLHQHVVAVRVTDTVMAVNHLKLMSDSAFFEGGDSLFRLAGKGKALSLFAPLSAVSTGFAIRKNDWLYFADEKDQLQLLIRVLKSGQLISGDASFANYKSQHFYESFNYMVYNVPEAVVQHIPLFFNFTIGSKKQVFHNFRHFSFSLARQGKRFKFRCQLLHETEKANNEQPMLWSLKLDTLSGMKAAGFINHQTRENELLVQDEANTLYLVNAKGTVLWKKKLNERIHSDIFTVDAFKNNKYQALFSSKNYLHLIDRNGHYVEGYPVKLPAEATAPLSLFDYERNHDYRLFIACQNRLIYNYAINGAKQNGFVPFKTENRVKLAVQYIKVGLSDYLVAVDEEGKIYTFSRRGDERIGLKNRTTVNCSGFYLDGTSNINTTCLVYADNSNNAINRISFSDKKALVKLDNVIENAVTDFGSVDEAGNTGFIFTRPSGVLTYDLHGNLLLSKIMDKELRESIVYKSQALSVLITYSSNRGELQVADLLTQRVKKAGASAMPLATHLFNDHKLYLVITQGNRFSCMLLN